MHFSILVHFHSTTHSQTSMENFETVEVKDLLDIENFAKNFKKRRIELKFTQKDVATFCSDYYNHDMSQTTVSRFEALELRFLFC